MIKRVFDIAAAVVLLVLFSPLYLILAVAIKIDSPGPVFYRQKRITQYGNEFMIHKFRSMYDGSDKRGSLVTVKEDSRVTHVGKIIRKFRLDEIAQLLDVIQGNMTFVGVRPEVPKYVAEYSKEMQATLLLPAGITNLACIYYKDEASLIENVDDTDEIYISIILPEKMVWNLRGIKQFSFWNDIKILIMTFLAVCGKKYIAEDE